jgi:hypothetical protein
MISSREGIRAASMDRAIAEAGVPSIGSAILTLSVRTAVTLDDI